MAGNWETKITSIEPNEIRLRGYRIDELMGRITFSEAIYLLFRGELPDKRIKDLLEAIFVSSIDHGVTPPSAVTTRSAASTGAPLNAAVAAGVLSINEFHGGAIFNCMEALKSALSNVLTSDDYEKVAGAVVKEYIASKKRMYGFGHRLHTHDPRTARLFELANIEGQNGPAVRMINAIADAYQQAGKSIPINVDGAIAAVLIDLDIPHELANAFFIIARVPGLFAHAFEEKTSQPSMRQIITSEHVYTGERARKIEDRRK